MNTETVLITGATGFIGRNLIKKMFHLGYKTIGISKNGGIIDDIIVDAVDCRNQKELNSYCDREFFNGVINLAAFIPSIISSHLDNHIKRSIIENVQITMNVMDMCKNRNDINVIYTSSVSVYGYPKKIPANEKAQISPNGFYPLGKLFGELICQQYQDQYGIPVSILRISSPYGPGMQRDTVIKKFIMKALLSEDITLYGTGKRSQDFIYIDDVIDAIILAYETKTTGTFNLTSGESTSMQELAAKILSVLPYSKSKIIYSDIADTQEDYRGAFSIRKARKTFGYKPQVYLYDGIRKYSESLIKELKT